MEKSEERREGGRPLASLRRSGKEASGASSIESLRGEGRSKSEARSSKGIGAAAPLEPQERSHSMEARGRERVEHPEVVRISIKAEEAELPPFGISEPELRGKRRAFGEKDGHGEREASQHRIQSIAAPSLAISGEARCHVDARGASGDQPRERSLPIVVEEEARHRGEAIRHRGEASREGSPKELGEERGLLL
jgi:hypothetical protein